MAARLGADTSERDLQLFFGLARTCRAVATERGLLSKITAKVREFTASQGAPDCTCLNQILSFLHVSLSCTESFC